MPKVQNNLHIPPCGRYTDGTGTQTNACVKEADIPAKEGAA